MTAALIAAIVSGVSCPSPLGQGGLEDLAVMLGDPIWSHQQNYSFSVLLHVPDKFV